MKPLTILIVDDLPINRKLLTAQLAAEGHTVLAAEHGAEALSILERTAVDVTISDILMPVMDGYQLCAAVRNSARLRDLPFIFHTATYTSPADEELCMQLGANRYLRKPVGARQLLAAIEESLGSPAPRPQVAAADVLEYNERLVFKLEQKNVELADAADRLSLQATALDAAADAILITDEHGAISWVNRAFSAVTGHAAEAAVGRTAGELELGVPDDVFTTIYWQTRAERVWRGEAVMRNRRGRIQYNEVTVTPVLDEDNAITHFVGVMHDVTERKRTEEQLREFVNHSPASCSAEDRGDSSLLADQRQHHAFARRPRRGAR
jgi:PAS domain S-box-containing protein